jgi:putative tryptophan/tyrosine transport system substrate-binding protein
MPFDQLKRRQFVALLGGATAWPLMARAQQMVKLPTVGFLGAGSPATADVWLFAFTSRLRELGWIEDRNIKMDVRWAEGRNDRPAEIAADFVRLRVDVIVTYSSEHTQIAKQATSIIPIVFALAADPVGSGLVASLARPGGNLTGLSAQNVDLTGKRFELLRDIVPSLRRLAILFNGNNPTSMTEIDIVRAAASPFGIEVFPSEILGAEDIAPAIATIAKKADALFVVGEPLTFTHRTRINTLALAARLPTTYSTRGYVAAASVPRSMRSAGTLLSASSTWSWRGQSIGWAAVCRIWLASCPSCTRCGLTYSCTSKASTPRPPPARRSFK